MIDTKFKKELVPWNKGKSPSEETLKKLSESHKGQVAWNKGIPMKEETRKRLSETKKRLYAEGKIIHPNKGKHLSKELRKKISETTSKAMLNPDIRKRLSKSHKGRHLSPKTEFKKGLVSWNKGKIGIYSEESLKKMSTSAKLTQNEGRYKKGHTFSEETINKQRLAKIGKKTSEETKKKLKSIWNKPEYIKLAKERRAKLIFPVKDSLPEIKIQNFLRQLGIPFLKHKHIKEIEHSYQCDIFIPSMNLIIECDGNYWHKYPVGREIDNLRTNELIDKGFKVLRLWESDIKKMNFKDFIERIKPFEKV